MGVSKESIIKFLIGNQFHEKLRILSPYSNRPKSWTKLVNGYNEFDLDQALVFCKNRTI